MPDFLSLALAGAALILVIALTISERRRKLKELARSDVAWRARNRPWL